MPRIRRAAAGAGAAGADGAGAGAAGSRPPRTGPPSGWTGCSGCCSTRNNWTASVFWAEPPPPASSCRGLGTSGTPSIGNSLRCGNGLAAQARPAAPIGYGKVADSRCRTPSGSEAVARTSGISRSPAI